MTAQATISSDGCCAPPRRSGVNKQAKHSIQELADLAKAVGHPARVQILRLLLERDTCVAGEIVEQLPLAQSTVSQHLKVLREAGLITGCEDGSRICYCVDPKAIARLKELVTGL